jgi:hypothetical protein
MIGSVVESGQYIYIYNEKGSLTGQIKNGENPGDGLVGYTGSVVNVRCGNSLYNYNEKGALVNQTWAGDSKKQANYFSGGGILFFIAVFLFLYPGRIFNQLIGRHLAENQGFMGPEFNDPLSWVISIVSWGSIAYFFYWLITSSKSNKIKQNLSSPQHREISKILVRTGLTININSFIKEGVDDSLLYSITDLDLINLGMKKTGDRLQFLAELESLKSSSNTHSKNDFQ